MPTHAYTYDQLHLPSHVVIPSRTYYFISLRLLLTILIFEVSTVLKVCSKSANAVPDV